MDRDTAKIVAFNVQKLARKSGRAVLAATTHEDLVEDLAPSVHIQKGWGKRIRVKYFRNEINKVCSVTKEMRIEEGTREDYDKLAEFHYRTYQDKGDRLPPPIKFFVFRREDGEPVGVMAYCYPGVLAFGRSKAMGRRVPIEEVNRDFALISRVILHPKYRSIGLGVRLVKETLPLVNRPYVEMIAVMARCNLFAEKAGMTKIVESVPSQTITKVLDRLHRLSFNPMFLASEKQNLHALQKLNQKQLENVKEALLSISSGYYKRLKGAHKAYVKKSEFKQFVENATLEQLASVLRKLAILTQTKVYLLWKNAADS